MQATLIVDKIHLHLLPSMNPDGFAAETGPTRNNAHDIDLNRDFPDQVRLSNCLLSSFSVHYVGESVHGMLCCLFTLVFLWQREYSKVSKR